MSMRIRHSIRFEISTYNGSGVQGPPDNGLLYFTQLNVTQPTQS